MDYIARHGYDVYLLDVRGYGKSTRPAAMSQPPASNPPIATTEEAAADVAAVVEFVRKRRGVDKVNLLGWSWGTAIMAFYTERNNDKVHKLALYAPLHVRKSASLVQAGPGPVGAYRTVSLDSAKQRWLTGVAPDKAAALIPAGWFETWAKANLEADPEGAKRTPPVIRAPNGVIADSQKFWANGKSIYEPANIRVPTLLIKGEWDVDTPAYMAQAVFEQLKNAPYKRYVEIGEGTHTVMMERNRMQLFREVQTFLDEPRP
jgi:pimeloyl-ACP methyl ester carboxylesterase